MSKKSRPRRAIVVDDTDSGKKSKSKSKASSKSKNKVDLSALSVSVLKSKGLKMVVSFTEFKGSTYLDFREFYKTKEDEWKPTKKGVTVPANKSVKVLRRLGKLVQKAADSDIQTDEE